MDSGTETRQSHNSNSNKPSGAAGSLVAKSAWRLPTAKTQHGMAGAASKTSVVTLDWTSAMCSIESHSRAHQHCRAVAQTKGFWVRYRLAGGCSFLCIFYLFATQCCVQKFLYHSHWLNLTGWLACQWWFGVLKNGLRVSVDRWRRSTSLRKWKTNQAWTSLK